MKVTPQEGERLDSVFFRFYQMSFDQKAYDNFMMTNHHLLLKDTLNATDEVEIDEIEKNDDIQTEGLFGITL